MAREEYFCPDCGQVHGEPGTCPICGNPLMSIEEGEKDSPGGFSKSDFISAQDAGESDSENNHALEDQFI